MAIYSLRHTPIGRSTQSRPHTAAAHIGYISRPQAAGQVMAERMPQKPKAAADYLKKMEDGDRVNARVADKVMLALPKELDPRQRADLVRGYANDVTKGRAPWLAAIHDKGEDAQNPHCHLLIRDRDPDTGKRVIGMSDAGSTDMLREKWEQHANRALELAEQKERIDRRSLKAQGIERAPTIHEGPNVRAMEARGARPRSRPRQVRNGRGARQTSRQVDYPAIDGGQTRPAYNRSLRAPETESDYWDAIDRDTQRRDFAERGMGADYRRWEKAGRRPELVDGVRGFAVQPQQGSNGVIAPGKFQPGTVPAALPVGPFGVGPSPGVFKPAAEGIGGRERKDDLADQLGTRPVRAALRGEHPEGRKTEEHPASMGQPSKPARGSAMSDQDDRLRKQHADEREAAKFEADQSRGRFDDLMKRSYRDPQTAEKKMEDYRANHGDQALYDKLAGNERRTAFGRRPGSIASPDGYQPGAGDKQRESQIARRMLPDAMKKMHQDRERLGGAEQTLQNGQPAQPQPSHAPVQEPSLAPSRSEPAQGRGQPQTPAQSHGGSVPEQSDPQGNQHEGLVQTGQPQPAPPQFAPEEPQQRDPQGNQHHGLVQSGRLPRERQPWRPQPKRTDPQGNQHNGMVQTGQPNAPERQASPEDEKSPDPQGSQHLGLEQNGRPAPATPPRQSGQQSPAGPRPQPSATPATPSTPNNIAGRMPAGQPTPASPHSPSHSPQHSRPAAAQPARRQPEPAKPSAPAPRAAPAMPAKPPTLEGRALGGSPAPAGPRSSPHAPQPSQPSAAQPGPRQPEPARPLSPSPRAVPAMPPTPAGLAGRKLSSPAPAAPRSAPKITPAPKPAEQPAPSPRSKKPEMEM